MTRRDRGRRRGLVRPGSRDEDVAKIYRYYVNALKESSALDFDDLLLKTVELFEQSARVRSKYAQQFRFVMVDEYQDTNRPQYMLIRRAGRGASKPGRRRRSGPVHLQVARGRPP